MTEYGLHRGRAYLSLTVGILIGLLFLVVAIAVTGVWALVCLAAGLALLMGSVQTVAMLLDKRPLLRISPEGLFYRPFAATTAPWSEITAIAHVTSYSHSTWLGRVTWKRSPSSDQLNFAVADPSRYPNGVGRSISRAMQRLGGLPPIAVQLYFVDAAPEAIRAEIAKHWAGQIAEIDPRPRA